MRTTIFSILLFLLAFIISVVFFVPVQVLVDQFEDYVPENISLQMPEGTIVKGNLVVSSEQLDAQVPVSWKACFIDLLHPLGACLRLQIREVIVELAAQPWISGDSLNLYQIQLNTDTGKLAGLHPSFAVIAVIQGELAVDITQLQLDLNSRRPKNVEGQVRLSNASTLGLQLGTINGSLTTEPPVDGEVGDIIIAVEGGSVDLVKIQGSGTINPQGQINIRFLARSNDRSIQQQLAAITKRLSDTEFEFNYSASLSQ